MQKSNISSDIRRQANCLIWDIDVQLERRGTYSSEIDNAAEIFLGKWKNVRWPKKDGCYGIRIRHWNMNAKEYWFLMEDGKVTIELLNASSYDLLDVWLNDYTIVEDLDRASASYQVYPQNNNKKEEDNMEMTGIVIPIGTPSTRTGRIFSRETAVQMLADFDSKDISLGELDGEGVGVDLQRVSHRVESLFIEGGNLCATIKVLENTPMGNILKQLLEAIPGKLYLKLCGTGKVNEDSIVEDFSIIRIDVAATHERGDKIVEVHTPEDLLQFLSSPKRLKTEDKISQFQELFE